MEPWKSLKLDYGYKKVYTLEGKGNEQIWPANDKCKVEPQVIGKWNYKSIV